MLQVQSLGFDYADQTLLTRVKFSLEKGCLLHLRGDNGSGKTTLLRLLAGILQPDSGAIYYNNKAVQENMGWYQHQLCYVGHKPGFNARLTVRENCYFDAHWQRRPMDLPSLLLDFDLLACMDKPCYLLSAGQQRRMSLLRIMMTDAPLWLLDEPLVALDKHSIDLLTKCLLCHLAKGGQIVMTSHQALPSGLTGCEEYIL